MDLSNPVDVIAGTAWGECRGGGARGMHSVINVIMNRAKHPRWWGSSPSTVCLRAWQFSCWNTDDPNRDKILAVTPDDPEFAIALKLASAAMARQLADITGGADSYYDIRESPPPDWSVGLKPTTTIAGQAFFRTEI